MNKRDINLTFNVHCKGSQGDSYRVYLGKDLLTERTWRWSPATTYLKETAPVRLLPGTYDLKIERVEPGTGVFSITDINAIDNRETPISRVEQQRIVVL